MKSQQKNEIINDSSLDEPISFEHDFDI